MILKFNVYARKLDRNMPIHMYLPDTYMDAGQDFPVLYMFDGHNVFNDEDATYGRSWRLANYIGNDCPEMIVVGIECSHTGNDRLSEYAPFPFYDPEFGGHFEGAGYKTMHFLVHDLRPYILKHFPASPDRNQTFIGGSSCGGLMALYGLYRYSSVFSRGLAISPYLIPCQSSLMADISQTRIRKNSRLYFSWGAREGHRGHEFVQETKIITEAANLLMDKGVAVRFNMKLYGEHCEADWEAEAPEFLRFLFS